VPPTLRGVLQARLDRLPLEDRTVLQQASVVGRLFWDRAVVRINETAAEGVREAAVLDTLSDLRRREMVFQRETTAIAGAQEYVFKHAVLREVTYRSLLKRLRRVYHGLVADWLMEQAGERAGEYTGLIADHLELAGRTGEAIERLLEAGDRARGLYAHQEAIGAYERALTLLKEQGDQERAARTLMKLGLTHHTAYEFERSRNAYEEAFALWRPTRDTAPRETPLVPRTLRVSMWDPQTLDPGRCFEADGGYVIDQLFSGLVELTPQLSIVPSLANRWEVSEGGRRYVFHLTDDLRWSDGTPLTAGDFEYAWKRVLDPVVGSPNGELLYAVKGARAFHSGRVPERDRVGVQAPDEVTLVVELEDPTGYFLHLLTHHSTFPVPRHVVEAHGDSWTEPGKMVTNGPFTIETWKRGKSLLLLRNPQYLGDVTGNVDRVELTVVRDEPKTLELYDADVVDLLNLRDTPLSQTEYAQQRYPKEHHSRAILSTQYAGFGVTRRPFDDPRVRRAFALAIDREELAEAQLQGRPSPILGGFVPRGMPGHSPGIALAYDPARSRRLLREAGYPGGRGFPRVEAVLGSGRAYLGEQLRAQWKASLGIDIAWESVPFARLCDRLHAGEPPHIYVCGWVADYPDPDSFLRTGHIQAHSRWRDKRYEQLVEQASRIMDQGRRMDLYRQADRILVEEAVIAPLYYPRHHFLVKPWVRTPARGWKDVIIEPH
jgi:oligopeptide transport system substrate-binding protein